MKATTTKGIKERPILFSAPMVRAILEGRKTQTRRIVKPYGLGDLLDEHPAGSGIFCEREFDREECILRNDVCSYGKPGERLWVKETFMPMPHLNAKAFYRASDPLVGGKWKPSIFMPRTLSRILLSVVSVRVERLNDISALDAMAEGIEPMNYSGQDFWKNYQFKANTPGIYVKAFRWQADSYCSLWESINGPGSWAENPWVWVITFSKIAAS